MCYSLVTMIAFDKLNNLISNIKAASNKIKVDGAILHVVSYTSISDNEELDSLKKFAKVEDYNDKALIVFKDDSNYKKLYRKKLSKLYQSYLDNERDKNLSELNRVKSSLILSLNDSSSFSPSIEDKIIFSLVRLYESNDVLLGNQSKTKTKVLDFDFVKSQKYIVFKRLFSRMLNENSLEDITYYISNYQSYYTNNKKYVYNKLGYRGLERYYNEFSSYKRQSMEHMIGYKHIYTTLRSPISSLINAIIHDYISNEDLLSLYWTNKVSGSKESFLANNPFAKTEFINMYANLLDYCSSERSKVFLSFVISVVKDDYLKFMYYSSDLFSNLLEENEYFVRDFSGIKESDSSRFKEEKFFKILPEMREIRSIFGIENITLEDYELFINDLDKETYKAITYDSIDFINIPLIRKVFYTDD